MIFIRELDHRATELSKILFDQIFEIVTRQDCLILQDADISPRIDDFRVYVPQSSVTKKICSVMKETRWAYNLSVVDAIDFHHLSGFRTQKEHQAVLLLLRESVDPAPCAEGIVLAHRSDVISFLQKLLREV
jgi:hypothetical protein